MTYTNPTPSNCMQSDYSSNCRLNVNGSDQERMFMENLAVESIELYGQDLYYLPRTYVGRDNVLDEIDTSTFSNAYPIRGYVNTQEGWEGQGELLTKFGVRIEDKTTFIVSRKKFTEKVDNNVTLNVEGRPNEGDLVWFPVTKHLFEIKFVEAERPFYQLGKGYVWEMQCEIFEYSNEDLDTGIADIDAIEYAFSNSTAFVMGSGGTGAFTVGEIVIGELNIAVGSSALSGDGVGSVTITDGGEYYTSAPAVTFTGGGGSGAAGTAVISAGGLVTGVTINTAGTGYTSAPTVTFGNSPKDTQAEVKSWDAGTRTLQVINRTGTFNTGENITGQSSSAVWSPESYNTIDNTNSEVDQNYTFETADDDIIDFSEGNPFGSIGSTTDLTI